MITLVNETSLEKVPIDIKEIIPDVIETYQKEYGKDILEIRLLGSIPRGEYIENVSDVDFICILKNVESVIKKSSIKEKEYELSKKLIKYTKIDLDVVTENFIENDYGYKLLVITDSICIIGNNKFWVQSYKISGNELSKLWNPNPILLLKEYGKRLKEVKQENEIKELSKLIGKDFIKAFRPILMKQNEVFSRSILKSKENLCKLDPGNSSLYEMLFQLYIKQTSSENELTTVMSEVEKYIKENKKRIFE